MDIDLGKMKLTELRALSKKVDAAIANFSDRRKAEARKEMEKVAKNFGLTVEEIVGAQPKKRRAATKKKKAAPAKFKNPADAGQTWSGRGRQPMWYKDALKAGKKPADLEI